MSVTDNWCPAGIMSMRHAFPVRAVNKMKGREAWTATCPVCKRPDTPAVRGHRVGEFYMSGHKESNMDRRVVDGRYVETRGQDW